MIEFFDRQGRATAFCDGQTIYFWDGRPAAYILDDKVYAFSGRFIGWFTDGWIVDELGRCLLFESDAVRGPGKPTRQPKSTADVRGARTARGALQTTPPRPQGSAEWSDQVFADLL